MHGRMQDLFGIVHAARHLLGGSGHAPPPKKCLNGAFGVYFGKILTQISSKKYSFLYKNNDKLQSCRIVARGFRGKIHRKLVLLVQFGVHFIPFRL